MNLSDDVIAELARAIGIDAQEVARRKEFLEFDETDIQLLTELHTLLQDASQQFVDNFYTHLIRFEETRSLISDSQTLERLKKFQADYFDSLTAGNYDNEYILRRLRVGIVHQRIGLEPKWYLGAYNKYLIGLLPELWRLLGDNPDKLLATYRALQKIVFLDMGLALDTYIQADQHTILELKHYAENIIASLPDGLIVVDSSTLHVRSVNRSFREMFGLKEEEDLSGCKLEDLLPLPDLRQQAQSVLTSGVTLQDIDAELGNKNLHLTITGIRLSDKQEEGRLLVIVEDVTEQKRAEDELRLAAVVFEQSAEAVIIMDAEQRALTANRAFTQITGYAHAEVAGESLNIIAAGRHTTDFFRTAWESVGKVGSWQGEFWYRDKSGETHPMWMVLSAVRNKEGRVTHYICNMADISERKTYEARIEQLAFYDPLTGLANRALLMDRLRQALANAERRGQSVAVLFMDLNRFKEINDIMGHDVGDQVLIEVAQRFQGMLRQADTLCRFGGDEFIIIAGESNHASAVQVAERLQQALGDPIVVQGKSFSVGTSIGIAFYPEDGQSADDLLKQADIAMYRAKASGGGYRFYRSDMSVGLVARLEIAQRLEQALKTGQLQLHYQPVVHLATKTISGAEALLRWNDPEWGWMSPAEFIPIAEERRMMRPLGEWVLQEACRQLSTWQEVGYNLDTRLAINISAQQLEDAEFVSKTRVIINMAGLKPGYFSLELTESSLMANSERAAGMMEALKTAGFSLSIDDFGTGHSSLTYLKHFPVDKLKIDISFVRDMMTDSNDYIIISTIIAMARTLGIRTVAEGVESDVQADALLALGCDEAQGYCFGRPEPADIFAQKWLKPATGG